MFIEKNKLVYARTGSNLTCCYGTYAMIKVKDLHIRLLTLHQLDPIVQILPNHYDVTVCIIVWFFIYRSMTRFLEVKLYYTTIHKYINLVC